MERMELYWMISTYVFQGCEMVIIGYMLYRFAKPFMENQRGSFWIWPAYCVTMLLLHYIQADVGNFIAYSIGILIPFIVMCRIDRRNYYQKIFLAVTFFSLRWLSLYLMGSLTLGLNEWVLNSAYMLQHPYQQLGAYNGVNILELFICFAILGASVTYIVKAYVYRHENMSVKEMCMLTTPSVTGMTGYGIMQYYSMHYVPSPVEALSGIYRWLAMLYYAISILTIVIMTVMFQNIKARQEEEMQNELLAAQIGSMRQHIGQVEGLYQDIRSLRHDMTNHILTLERLYEVNAQEEAKAYAADLKMALAEVSGEIKSGNPVTDVILQEIKRAAQTCGIRFESDFHYPAGERINAFDISVILNNALQNALEHAGDGKEPYLSIRSYCRKNAYMIEVKNSFDGNLRLDAETGLPLTTKEKADKYGCGQAHGYGLANIRRIARKYYGDIDIVHKDGEFQLSILLMME